MAGPAQGDEEAALIVTATLDAASQTRFDAARRRYFPAARNLIPAHVTLFHALPGAARAQVWDVLGAVCAARPASRFTVRGLRFLGRGVAYELEMPGLAAARAAVAAAFAERLTPQDAQAFRPHVTVQNKVAPEAARALLAQLQADFQPWSGDVLGMTLWRYEGGPWTALGAVPFSRHAVAKAPTEGQGDDAA